MTAPVDDVGVYVPLTTVELDAVNVPSVPELGVIVGRDVLQFVSRLAPVNVTVSGVLTIAVVGEDVIVAFATWYVVR